MDTAPLTFPEPGTSLAELPRDDGLTLTFTIAEAEMPRLLRAPAVLVRRAGTWRNVAAQTVWHDTADGKLAQEGLALAQASMTPSRPAAWRLERLHPGGGFLWLPATPPPVLAQDGSPDQLGRAWPGELVPVAAFHGRLRVQKLALASGPGTLSVLSGTICGVARDLPVCRLELSGQRADVVALARLLAETLPILPPRSSLAAEAMALATGRQAARRRASAPTLPPGLSTGEALACLTAQLAEAILHWAGAVSQAAGPEPVHQMRVGVRRLRSALGAFRRAAEADGPAPWLDELSATLKALAGRLGAARDWDVFLAETGLQVGQAFPGERRVSRLLDAARRRRLAAYADLAAYLAGQDWTRLAVGLALLPSSRPWERACDGHSVWASPLRDYAARALHRRLKHVLSAGEALSGLPAPALHETRKQAKRLRYATEFFGPVFAEKAARKYVARLADLQERLGRVNDTSTADALVRQLAGGAEHAFAAGVVQGFCAARAGRTQAKVQRSWHRLYRATPFWN